MAYAPARACPRGAAAPVETVWRQEVQAWIAVLAAVEAPGLGEGARRRALRAGVGALAARLAPSPAGWAGLRLPRGDRPAWRVARTRLVADLIGLEALTGGLRASLAVSAEMHALMAQTADWVAGDGEDEAACSTLRRRCVAHRSRLAGVEGLAALAERSLASRLADVTLQWSRLAAAQPPRVAPAPGAGWPPLANACWRSLGGSPERVVRRELRAVRRGVFDLARTDRSPAPQRRQHRAMMHVARLFAIAGRARDPACDQAVLTDFLMGSNLLLLRHRSGVGGWAPEAERLSAAIARAYRPVLKSACAPAGLSTELDRVLAHAGSAPSGVREVLLAMRWA